jgi:hypothetical protein
MRFLIQTTPHALLLRRFHDVVSGAVGKPEKGRIRWLFPRPELLTLEYALLTAYDRTVAEWDIFFMEQQKTTEFLPSLSFPLYTHMLEEYRRHMRVRWMFKKWINRVRTRNALRRCVGTTDLYSLHPVPDHLAVRIVDYDSKSVYIFHVSTIHRCCVSSLLYSSYGIASPQIPKNPYTNLPWKYGQMLELCRQINTIYASLHAFSNPMLISYMLSDYNLKQFTAVNTQYLRIAAAESMFKNVSDPDSQETYLETLDGLFDQGVGCIQSGWTAVRAQIVLRTLRADLLQRWDTLITASWIFDTYNMPYKHFSSVQIMNTEFNALFAESLAWWNAAPKTILRRS